MGTIHRKRFQRLGENNRKRYRGTHRFTDGSHPYFVRQLAHTVWNHTAKRCSSQTLDQAIDALFTQHAILFQREVDGLTNPQVNFLKALCDEVRQHSSAEVIREYHLGTSANVICIKEALVKKEILDIIPDRIEFIDPLS